MPPVPLEALEHLRGGGVIAYPTETVYGLGCLLLDAPLRALEEAKDRRGGAGPFILLVPSRGWAAARFRWDESAESVATALWPGPLTLVLEPLDGSEWPRQVLSETGEVACRVSSSLIASGLVRALDAPLVSTSANLRGEPPARTPEDAAALLQRLELGVPSLLIAGECSADAPPSTVARVAAGGIDILREGAVGADEINRAVSGVGRA